MFDAYAASGTATVDQMYVHYQVPVDAKRPPITLMRGNSRMLMQDSNSLEVTARLADWLERSVR